MRRPPHLTAQGFTLPEVMVALVVIAIGLGLAVFSMGTAMRWVRNNRCREFALHTLRRDMEEIRAMGYTTMTSASPSVHSTNLHDSIAFVTSFATLPSGQPDLSTLSVTTSWQNPFNPAQSVGLVMETKVAEPLH